MNATEAARREAERIHREAVAAGFNPWKQLSFVCEEAARRDIDVFPVPAGDPQLRGGRAVFDSQARIILYVETGSEFDRAFLVAHELGHVVLEDGSQDYVTESVQPRRCIEDAPVGIERVFDYSARERREVRMDLFAREFLLPRSMVRHLHLHEGYSSKAIAERLGAPVQVVQQQLLDALLLPAELQSEPQATATSISTPDESQINASTHPTGAFQLQAGPGTGKTRTLVSRIEWLLREGVDPKTILVLTFSNKAANELSERIAERNPAAVTAMWIGTFHAFGLDIVRRFHDKLGLRSDPRLIDKTDAIELLENELARLPLRHFRNLWDPVVDLSEMLNAISRAKDEVVDAAGYRTLAEAMLAHAGHDHDAVERAEKSAEVALLFDVYERLMAEKNQIDFGDLVALPVRLVESNADVRDALKLRHRHVLVDEYQDVNRASVRLLKAFVGDGENLWVVGDARQSIYRFRGASSKNMALFPIDFPGATIGRLRVNYRSSQEVVEVFRAFSGTMKASEGSLPLDLDAVRGVMGSRPEIRVVGSAEDEISAIATSIQNLHTAGVPFRKQALLCVSNARLSEIAAGLEARGIPVLHLGNLFERPEIQNLLSLLSMFSDPYAMGLVRVITIPSFEMQIQDALQIVHHLRERNAGTLEWRQIGATVTGLTAESQAAFARIAELFDNLNPEDDPWNILVTWVVDRLGMAKSLYLSGNTQSQMQGLALWQFLNFCRRQPSGVGTPCLRLMNRIRRIVLIAEDRGLRQMPSAGEGIDAVRLMTIHASKGLEFDIVHLPGLVATGLPRNNRPPRCIPPDGLIHGSEGMTGLEAVKVGHEEEEECLFFVALSRAKNRLLLYASSLQDDGKRRSQSRFIPPIAHLLVRSDSASQLVRPSTTSPAIRISWEDKPTWTESQVSMFERCPRRFLYTHVFKLGGRRTETAFMKMHDAVSDVFNWLKTTHETTTPIDTELDARFEEAWQNHGALDHGFDDDYRRIGRELVDFLVQTRSLASRLPVTPLTLQLADGVITVKPDSITRGDRGQVVVGRVKTGKLSSNSFDDIEFAILHLAAVRAFGDQVKIEVTFLTSESIEPYSITAKKLENRGQKIVSIIQSVRSGDFPAKSEVRTCPRCPNFFICGDLPSGPVHVKKL